MGKCDADSGVLFSACLPVSQSLRSDARCCDAGCGVVSPACLPVSPSLRGQIGWCLSPVRSDASYWLRHGVSRLSPCVSQWLRVVSPACLSVCPSLCGQLPDAVPVSAVGCLFNAYSPQQGPGQNQLKLLLLCEFWG